MPGDLTRVCTVCCAGSVRKDDVSMVDDERVNDALAVLAEYESWVHVHTVRTDRRVHIMAEPMDGRVQALSDEQLVNLAVAQRLLSGDGYCDHQIAYGDGSGDDTCGASAPYVPGFLFLCTDHR